MKIDMALALVCTMAAAVLFQPVLMGRPRRVNAPSEQAEFARSRRVERAALSRSNPSRLVLTLPPQVFRHGARKHARGMNAAKPALQSKPENAGARKWDRSVPLSQSAEAR